MTRSGQPLRASSLRALPKAEQDARLARLTAAELEWLQYDWQFWARDNQLAPAGQWRNWLLLAGRGFGKTRTAAEWIRQKAESGQHSHLALIGATAADVRDVMVKGESGLLAICPPWNKPVYNPSNRSLTWPNGAVALTFSGADPDQVRGPQCSAAWIDELAKMRYATEVWDNLQPGLRLGRLPQCTVTTTPKPIAIMRRLVADSETVITRGSTYENKDNLASSTVAYLERTYGGTRLGRQELSGELLEDVEGALWQRAWFDNHRATSFVRSGNGPAVVRDGQQILLKRIYVVVDPAITHGDDSDQTGIAVVAQGEDNDYYVLEAIGVRLTPEGWPKRVLDLFDRFGAVDILAESNQGGEMVRSVIKKVRSDAPVRLIRALKSKTLRAEPVALLYEQGRVHHVGTLADAEDQMCSFPVAADHDDILDAIVHGITELHARSGGLLVSFI